MLQIRFNRIGKKNRAIFRIVLQEHTIAPGGKHVEILGSWDPHQKKGVFQGEKIKEWITKGAQVTDSVWNLLIREKVVEGEKKAVKINKKTEKLSDKETTEQKKSETAEPAKEEVKAEEKKDKITEPVKEDAKSEEAKAEELKVEEAKVEEKKEEKKPEEPKK